MITLTQAEGRAVQSNAEKLLLRKLSNAINKEILQRYYAIEEKKFTPKGDETPEELQAGWNSSFEIDFPLFPLSMLSGIGDYQADFLIGPMVKLFDLYT